MKLLALAALTLGVAAGQMPRCDFQAYKGQDGLKAEQIAAGLTVTWTGERREEMRVLFTLSGGQPSLDLSVRKAGGEWHMLGRQLVPEFDVVSGRRRVSQQQLNPLEALKVAMTPAVFDRERWNAFWDAPLDIPGNKSGSPEWPRRPEEIRRAKATYAVTSCVVKTDGARLEVTFPGLSMGIFSGELRFTVYRGTNLLRQEAIAKTDEPAVAYKYNAGLRGFEAQSVKGVVWQDVTRAWQQYQFGGAVNRDPVALRARNRLAIVDTVGGSLAVFPPPHKFFWAREIELNLGYVYYRKDSEENFSIGVRQAEHEEEYRPYGVSEELWKKRADQSRHNLGNFALYNAPPGTWQHMAAYYYLSPDDTATTQASVLQFTHGDRYKPLPGYQVTVSHFHTHFNEQLTDAGTIDFQPTWLPVFRNLGVNVAMMSDFHGDSHLNDPGPLRLAEQKVYFEGCQRFSDRNFLLMPGEEPNVTFGGHYTMVFPRPVFWTHVRGAGQAFKETTPQYGAVYHVGSKEDELEMMRQEQGLIWQSHPRTKGSTGYPDASREAEHFRSDRFLGGSFQSLPVDLSEQRICEKRCFGVLDDMNNWVSNAPGASVKYMIAEGDTYMKYPDDETYPHLMVNYVKLDRLPRFNEDWSPILRAMRAGDFFVSSGEVLLRRTGVEGAGAKRTFVAEIEYTFPLEFVELVWGDGEKTGREIVAATELAPLSSRTFRIPFDAAGKKWVRFAAWDSAGNGAVGQPVLIH